MTLVDPRLIVHSGPSATSLPSGWVSAVTLAALTQLPPSLARLYSAP